MGPRSDERGNPAAQNLACRRQVASMGPRSDERGNRRIEPVDPERHRMLQWGRVRMNAEITQEVRDVVYTDRFNGAAFG